MNSFQSSLYTAAFTLCFFSAGILRGKRSQLGTSFTYFCAFLAVESVGFVLELLMSHPAVPLKGLWLGLRMGCSLLVAPCLWLAVQEIVEGKRPRILSLGRGQILLIAAGFALTLPLIENSHFGTDYPNPHRIISAFHSRFIHGTMLLCLAIFGWQVPFYVWQCRQLLKRKWDHCTEGGSQSTAWLHLPLIAVSTTWILGLLRTIHCAAHAPFEWAVIFSFIDVSVTGGAIYAIGRRASSLEFHSRDLRSAIGSTPTVVCEQLPSADLPVELAVVAPPFEKHEKGMSEDMLTVSELLPDDIDPLAATTLKYRKSALPALVRGRIKRKLEHALSKQECYRDSLLSLRSLSATLKEDVHYVSQVLNQDLSRSFYQLVNERRIERAKQLLLDCPDQTVLEIALEVGFNSKSTFNKAFRRNAGVTPREYRAKRLPDQG